MKTRTIRAGWTAFLAVALLHAGAAAQGSAKEPRSYVAAEAMVVDVDDVKAAVKSYRDYLAEVRVKVMSGRAADLGDWEARVDNIRVFADSSAFANVGTLRAAGKALLADLAVTRAQAYATLGRYAEARAALDHLLIPSEDPVLQGRSERFTAASPDMLALAVEAALDPRIAELRTDLSLTIGVAEPAADDFDETLREAVRSENWPLVLEIGSRAVPALEEYVLAHADDFPDDARADPLYYLVQISEHRAAALALAHLDSAGFAFRRRVLRAMDASQVLKDSGTIWGDAAGEFEPRPCLVPEWPQVVARLLADPELAREAMPSLIWILFADGVTPDVTAAVRAALSARPALVSDLQKALVSGERHGRTASARGIYEILVDRPEPTVRRLAAAKLADFPSSHSLWAHANDPDPLVRKSVAASLKKHQVGGRGEVRPQFDEQAMAALRTLLADSDSDVRLVAVAALSGIPKPLEPAVYRALAADPSPEVRGALVWLGYADDGLAREIYATLAGDADEEVLSKLDNLLDGTWARPGTLLSAARARLLGPYQEGNRLQRLVYKMAGSEEGTLALADCALNDADAALRALIWSNANRLHSSTGNGASALLALDDGRLARVFIQVAATDARAFDELRSGLARANPPRWSAVLPVIADADAPVQARLFAASYAAFGGGEAFRSAVLALLGGEPLRSRELFYEEQKMLDAMTASLPLAERNPMVLAALGDKRIRDSVCARIAGSYEPRAPGGREITLAVIARWLDAGGTDAAVRAMGTALEHLGSLPDDLDPTVLERAARNPLYAEAALETIAALQDPRYLPSVKGALNARRNDVLTAAITALTTCPGDAATEIMLDAMVTSPEERVRNACGLALQLRRQALEQRTAWERAKEVRIVEVDAVARLIELLKDDEPAIRIQAARGLATLRAVEALPLLIEALRDGNSAVRDAVSQALDRLNATMDAGADK